MYFSIKVTIKEQLAKNGGHLRPGNTVHVMANIAHSLIADWGGSRGRYFKYPMKMK